jgi:CHAD domain-containing protein
VVDRFVELEAELVKGSEARLASLAEVFAMDPALAPETGSKLDSALAVLGDGNGATRGETSLTTNGHVGEAESAAPAGAPRPSPTSRTETASGAAAEHRDPTPSTSDEVPEASEPSPDTRLVVGKTPGVTSDDHVAEAGRKVMRFHLARMLARDAGVRSGHDLEDVHAMRVATRRQRAAWRVFGASFRPGRTKRYRSGLRDVAARLGAVRDLDVLLEAADAYRADMPVAEQRALEPLLSDWRTHRDDARVLLIRELDSDDYRRWLDDYRDFVRTEGAAVLPVGATQPHRIRDTTASRVWTAYEQVRGYEPVLRWADVETLHDLRIAGKWLRYTLEFVREALGDDAAPLIARVTALQDHLGLLNDANVAASMARTFLVEHAGDLSGLESAAIGRYLVSREREVTRLKRSVGPPWRGVAGIGFRRALGRVVAGL